MKCHVEDMIVLLGKYTLNIWSYYAHKVFSCCDHKMHRMLFMQFSTPSNYDHVFGSPKRAEAIVIIFWDGTQK